MSNSLISWFRVFCGEDTINKKISSDNAECHSENLKQNDSKDLESYFIFFFFFGFFLFFIFFIFFIYFFFILPILFYF